MSSPEDRRKEAAVRGYYDRNTRRFLRLGASRKELTIHRAVWSAGVRTRSAALETTNRLVLAMLEEIHAELHSTQPLHVLDLGCGVGGTLFFLARHFPNSPTSPHKMFASGVTLSPVQAQLAAEYAAELGLAQQCVLYTASYLDLPLLPPANLVVAVESFLLGPDPARFFQSAAAALAPGGRLVLIDDFLSANAAERRLHPRQEDWINEFRAGWHANSLLTPAQASDLAAAAGLQCSSDRDLTPDLRLLGPRDRVVSAAVSLGRRIPPLQTLLGRDYFASLVGGNALQHGLKAGIFEYHILVFAR